MNFLNLSLVSLLILFSISLKAGDFQSDKDSIEKAHQTVNLVRENFRKTLQDAIKEKGVQGSIGDCRVKAPSLEKSNENIEIGRTSHKLRNQLNQPREWVKPILDEYVKTPPAQQARKRLVQLGPNHYGYVEPIYVEAVCLNCHGSQVKSDVRSEIRQYYPKDKALDFKLGDFRGLIWLESRSK